MADPVDHHLRAATRLIFFDALLAAKCGWVRGEQFTPDRGCAVIFVGQLGTWDAEGEVFTVTDDRYHALVRLWGVRESRTLRSDEAPAARLQTLKDNGASEVMSTRDRRLFGVAFF